jgi:hypothetical protein
MNTFTQGFITWKMVIFRGLIYTIVSASTAFVSGLQDYKALSDLDALTWIKIVAASIIAAGTNLGGFLDSSFTRKKDELKPKV